MQNMLDLLDNTKDEDKGKWVQCLETDIKIFREEVDHLKTASQDERLVVLIVFEYVYMYLYMYTNTCIHLQM